MDKILLIIPNATLRQLYHGLLLSNKIEVVAVETITHGILLLTITPCSAVVIHIEEATIETQRLLTLRLEYPQWKLVPFILLTPESHLFSKLLSEKDVVINPLLLNPSIIVQKIIASL